MEHLLLFWLITMEVPNLYAFSYLISKLFEYLGDLPLSQEELPRLVLRSLHKKKGRGDLCLLFTSRNQEKVRLRVDDITNLCTDSLEWLTPISTCSFIDRGLILNLDRTQAFKTVIHNVISQGEEYGSSFRSCQEVIFIRYNSEDLCSDLSETRVALSAKVTGKLLQAVGYKIEINPKETGKMQPTREFFFTHKSMDDRMSQGSTPITCGVILNAETRCKEYKQTTADYYRHWEDIISRISQERDTGESKEVQSEINAHISRAAVLFGLLGIKLSNCVTLENGQDKGAPFVLYNTARIASIRSKFLRRVDAGSYPELPPFDQVDTSLLNCEEEWSLLLHYIMTYPYVIKDSLTGLNEGKPNIHHFVLFINAFCKEISLYYRRVRILTESRLQLLPTMFARLYLLKSVEQVLHNALNILDVKPLLHM